MRCYSRTMLFKILPCLTVLMACGEDQPTLYDLAEEELSSVDGPWQGLSFDSTAISLQFSLSQNGQQVTGSGGYQDARTPQAIPIKVTGTFVRPKLSLQLEGIIFEGVAVTGQFVGDYVLVAGVMAPLRLVGEGTSREIEVLLQESL